MARQSQQQQLWTLLLLLLLLLLLQRAGCCAKAWLLRKGMAAAQTRPDPSIPEPLPPVHGEAEPPAAAADAAAAAPEGWLLSKGGPAARKKRLEAEARAAEAAERDAELAPLPPARPPPVLRPYQADAIDVVIDAFEDSERPVTRQLISMPTGAGKTVTFTTLAQRMAATRPGMRVLVLVHREQLLSQTVSTLERVWPGVSVGVVQGKRDTLGCQVVVATVQTAHSSKRLDRLVESDTQHGFGLCIVDEAHHAPAATYQMVLKHLGFLKGTPDRLLLGVTATPYRLGKLLLTDTFEQLSFHVHISDLIHKGHLCKVRARRIITHTDLSNAKLEGSAAKPAIEDSSSVSVVDDDEDVRDFKLGELDAIINTAARNKLVAEAYMHEASGRRAIAFCCSIAHANDMAAAFVELGVKADALHSGKSKEEQDSLLARHRSGELDVLTNVAILTEGYDDAGISCVLMSRPTRSKGLYTQCVGRGFRVDPTGAKDDCLVLDFTDVFHRLDTPAHLVNILDVIDPASVFHQDYDGPSPGVIEELKRLLVEGGEMELFDADEPQPRYAWVRVRGSLFLQLSAPSGPFGKPGASWGSSKTAYLQLRPTPGKKAGTVTWLLLYTMRGSGVWEDADWTPVMDVGPRSKDGKAKAGKDVSGATAVQAVEDKLLGMLARWRELAVFTKTLARQARGVGWRSAPVSDKQLSMLKELGVDVDALMAAPRLEGGGGAAAAAAAAAGTAEGHTEEGGGGSAAASAASAAAADGHTGEADGSVAAAAAEGHAEEGGIGGAAAEAAVAAGSAKEGEGVIITKGAASDAITTVLIERLMGGQQLAASGRSSAPATEKQVAYVRKLLAAVEERLLSEGGAASGGEVQELPEGAPAEGQPAREGEQQAGSSGTLPEVAAPGSFAWQEWLDKAAEEAAGLGGGSGCANVSVLREWVCKVGGELDAGVSKLRVGALIEDLRLASTRLKRAHELARKLRLS
ncbi:hypothetical protein FOA52_010901 [Chlamydomonas sp. UWO 241]|nr:hypothetical protein FOA52_010901 [Chlamydomonas sp. UWO 241]